MLAFERLENLVFEERVQSYSDAETIMYALCAGYGSNPLAQNELKFVYEKDLVPLPTMAHVLGMDGDWLSDPANGIDMNKMLHGESRLLVHKPLPASGTIRSKGRILDVIDKGTDKGALVVWERHLVNASDEPLATTTETFVLRGNGGFGGKQKQTPVHQLPSRDPDLTCDLATLPQVALLYRLMGDRNPLHADPAVAAKAGFARPILHGACTYAISCRAILSLFCGDDPTRLRAMHVRFSAPVYPGETIRTQIWRDSEASFSFRCLAVERDIVVLNNGSGEIFS